MIPLMTKLGKGSKMGANNHTVGEFRWLPYAPAVITEWFDSVVFPWVGMQSRVMALITQPGVSNYEHIDCEPHELNTRQHKFRIVLQGNTNTLYFKTTQGNIPAPDIQGAFVMDGGWPHGMTNNSNQIKVTLALGAPWTGNNSYNDLTVLLNRKDYQMPEDLSSFWKK